MRSRTNSATLIAAGAILLTAAGASMSSAQAAPAERAAAPASSTSVSSTSPLTAAAKAAGKAKYGADATYKQSLTAYWTADRMASAIPVEKSPAFTDAAKQFASQQKAQGRTGRKPVTNDGPVRSVAGAESKKFAGPAEAAFNPNLPYYTPTAYTAGKVFFTRAGLSYVCSGTIVNSEGKDSVWTAGHCVHGGSGSVWHSNWAFVPAYDDDLANPRPYGTWTAAFLSSRSAWTNSSDFSQDMGVATMNTNLGGWHIADYFGGQGITVNRGKNVFEHAFGYPAETPFDGGNLFAARARPHPSGTSSSPGHRPSRSPAT